MNTDTIVSRQWATRPGDQRFLSLDDLRKAVEARKESSRTTLIDTNKLLLKHAEEAPFIQADTNLLALTHWTFGQLCSIAHAPAGYLRELPPEYVRYLLTYGLNNTPAEKTLLLFNEQEGEARAFTSPTYGRIWDAEVVAAVQRIAATGNWKVPAASYATVDPKRATTLYGSDRDVFIFLVDDQHPITIPGQQEPLFRGFYTWNSEVGSTVFGLATFLYNRVCDNRIIWGITAKKELKIKHSGGAPARFLTEAIPALRDYSNEATQPVLEGIKKAQTTMLGDDDDAVKAFLQKRGLTAARASKVLEQAKSDGENPRSAWGVAQGITALARAVEHADARIGLERQAGDLLTAVTR